MTKHWTVLVTASLAALLAIIAPAPIARADIFQWEYINPAKPHRGKQQSMTLCVGGAGVDATPGANLYDRNLTMAYLIGANLTDAHASATNLTNADLSQANLTNADFSASFYSSAAILTGATLTGANFTGAEVRGATFSRNSYYPFGGSGLTPAQLSSTASYLAHDLTGIILENNTLTGVNLAGQNLTIANFYGATLTGASFNQANLTGANVGGATLTNANLTQANLTNSNFNYTVLTGANLTGAEVRGADFFYSPPNNYGSGLTAAQLQSTASYLAHDLSEIGLANNTLTGVNLASQNLSKANLGGAMLTGASFNQANLTGAYVGSATLTNADFNQANLTNANFQFVILTGANLTGAEVRGAAFSRSYYNSPDTGITPSQLYSTASYVAHDLTGVKLAYNNLAGVSLANQNLTIANFESATLTGASFNQANLTGASFYQATVTNANFNHANLADASFQSATLTGANLTGAEVRGTAFTSADYNGSNSGLTPAQLYSTASYQAHDLTGIRLWGSFVGINLAGQNLTSADFRFDTLTNANFSHANLTGADFSGYDEPIYDEDGNQIGTNSIPGAGLSGANLSGADARGANFYLAWLGGANTTNLIQSDGHIAGLDLTAGASLIVRDYDGNPAADPPTGPLPIVVDQHLAMDATGTLRLVFDADSWDSTISFAPGIPVALAGTLDLTFAPGVDVATQSGRTIDLFDWTGVAPTGAFTVESPYTWNLTNLYTTGEVTLTAVPTIPGDYNNNGVVDAADYVVWRKTGSSLDDYNEWRTNFGRTFSDGGSSATGSASASPEPPSPAIPEPSTLRMIAFVLALAILRLHGRSTLIASGATTTIAPAMSSSFTCLSRNSASRT